MTRLHTLCTAALVVAVQLGLASSAMAQGSAARLGAHLSEDQDVLVIASAIRTIFPTSSPLVRGRRICRADLRDPDCPPVSEDRDDGPRINTRVLFKVASALGRSDESAERAHVYLQRPLLVNDSIYLRLVVVERRVQRTSYEFVYQLVNGRPQIVRHERK